MCRPPSCRNPCSPSGSPRPRRGTAQPAVAADQGPASDRDGKGRQSCKRLLVQKQRRAGCSRPNACQSLCWLADGPSSCSRGGPCRPCESRSPPASAWPVPACALRHARQRIGRGCRLGGWGGANRQERELQRGEVAAAGGLRARDVHRETPRPVGTGVTGRGATAGGRGRTGRSGASGCTTDMCGGG